MARVSPEAGTFTVPARGKTGPNRNAPRGPDMAAPEAKRPDARGHTARLLTKPFSPASSAMPGPRVSRLTVIVMVVGMCSVEGLTALMPSEGAVDQPPGPNETRGTSRGSWMLMVCGETASIPGEGVVSRPPGRCTLIVRGHPRRDGHILSSVCLPGILIEKSPERFFHESFSH